ncbi:MAG: SurA N-terminal domain-containing protein [Thermodesulfovibrionia bacterium]
MKRFLSYILVLIYTFLLIECLYASTLLDRVVATVNGEVITWSELRRAIEFEEKGQLKGLGFDERERVIKGRERSTLNDLIDIRLQLQEAKRRGLNVSHSEVNTAIEDIKKKYNLSDEEFLNSLKAEGLTEEGYRRELSEQILLAKVINIEVRANIVVSDKEVEEYYKENEGVYNKERVKIRQIFLKRPKDGSIEKVEKKAAEIMKRIQEGEDFALLAKGFSEDTSAEAGGDIGYIERGRVLKEVEDVAFSLGIGEVSKPFWSSKGLHIIKVEDRTEGGFEKVRDEIKMVLMERAFQKRYEDWIKELREKAYIEINL